MPTSRRADPAAYRQMMHAALTQVRGRLARAGRDLDEPNTEAWHRAVAALPGYALELQHLVELFARAPVPGEPAIAAELHDTYAVALAAITARQQAGQGTAACQLAQRLADLLALELSWMPKP